MSEEKKTFKEKAKEIGEKAKTEFNATKERVVQFVKDHPKLVIGAIVLGGIGLSALKNAAKEATQPTLPETVESAKDPAEEREEKKRALEEWEPYQENWEKVNAFADTLELKEGEMFIIEDSKQYEGEYPSVDTSRPIVSHMVYDDGVYPPEETE